MREEPKERALLLGVKLNDGEDFVRSMEELANLAVSPKRYHVYVKQSGR